MGVTFEIFLCSKMQLSALRIVLYVAQQGGIAAGKLKNFNPEWVLSLVVILNGKTVLPEFLRYTFCILILPYYVC